MHENIYIYFFKYVFNLALNVSFYLPESSRIDIVGELKFQYPR